MVKSREFAKDLEAYQSTKELLLNRRLVPGQRIIYRDLEERLGMSKTPILSALVRLEQENLVVSRHNRGYYVKEWNSSDIGQIFELRAKLHEILVHHAIKNATKENLAVLKRALDEYLAYQSGVYDLKKFRLDIRFHIQIAKMVGNDYLTSVLDQQYSIMCCAVDVSIMTPLMKQFEQDHRLLYRAIERRDAREAKRILRSHDHAVARVFTKTNRSPRILCTKANSYR